MCCKDGYVYVHLTYSKSNSYLCYVRRTTFIVNTIVTSSYKQHSNTPLFHNKPHTPQNTTHTTHYTPHTTHSTLHPPHYTPHTTPHTLHTPHNTPHTLHHTHCNPTYLILQLQIFLFVSNDAVSKAFFIGLLFCVFCRKCDRE